MIKIINDRLYICDRGNNRVQVMNTQLEYVNSFGCYGNRDGEFKCPSDYFCETGNDDSINPNGRWFINDPLWDGQDCVTACECTFNSPPWFCKQLPQAATDDIEVRICSNVGNIDEDTPVEVVELYIR